MTRREELNSRLRALSESESSSLDAAARARITAAVRDVGPRVVRRARIQRVAVRAGAAVLSVAAVIVAGTQWLGTSRGKDAARDGSPLACASRPGGDRVDFTKTSSGRGEIDLGIVARVVAEAGTDAKLTERAPCKTVAAIERGRVTVHARDLGGGELVVTAPEADVVVRGTVFAVARARDELTVEVAEGLVEVAAKKVPPGAPKSLLLRPGRRAKVRAGGAIEEEAIGAEEQRAIFETVDLSASAAEEGAGAPGRATGSEGEQGGAHAADARGAANDPTTEHRAANDPAADERGGDTTGERGADPQEDALDGDEIARVDRSGRASEDRAGRSAGEATRDGRAARGHRDGKSSRGAARGARKGGAESARAGKGGSGSARAGKDASESARAGKNGTESARAASKGDAPGKAGSRAAPEREPWKSGPGTAVPAPDKTPPPSPPTPPRVLTEDELLRRGDALRRQGDEEGARKAYEELGRRGVGHNSQAAWIALARMELELDNLDQARAALQERARRFGDEDFLATDATWIWVRVETAAGNIELARKLADALIKKWPDTPQANQAREWQKAHRPK